MLADTVGFVRDLPHELVAAFRSTLSEAREADLLLHVIDAADPLREERIAQVDAVLEEIGAGDIPQLLVFNKIDRIEGAQARHDLPTDGHDRASAGRARTRVALGARSAMAWTCCAMPSARASATAPRVRRSAAAAGRRAPARAPARARGGARRAPRRARLDACSLDLAEADAARIVAHAYGEPLRPLLLEGASAPT